MIRTSVIKLNFKMQIKLWHFKILQDCLLELSHVTFDQIILCIYYFDFLHMKCNPQKSSCNLVSSLIYIFLFTHLRGFLSNEKSWDVFENTLIIMMASAILCTPRWKSVTFIWHIICATVIGISWIYSIKRNPNSCYSPDLILKFCLTISSNPF